MMKPRVHLLPYAMWFELVLGDNCKKVDLTSSIIHRGRLCEYPPKGGWG